MALYQHFNKQVAVLVELASNASVARADAVVELGLAVLTYARHARGGRTDPTRLSKLYGMTPTLRDPKVVLTEIAASESSLRRARSSISPPRAMRNNGGEPAPTV